MEAPSLLVCSIFVAIAFLLSASCTRLAIGYARRRRLIDEPGRRRSHSIPTPRGGGIGIVAGALFACAIIGANMAVHRSAMLFVAGAILIVGCVGWIDDHGHLSARMRLAAHAVAAALLLAIPVAWLGLAAGPMSSPALVLYALAVLVPFGATLWSINLHNFMDGINGLLAMQAAFVMAALALAFAYAGQPLGAAFAAIVAAATLGFLPFNFPHARIFMGDVGSGVLGLLIAVGVGWQMLTPGISLATGALLSSAFITDATCTLVSRMLRGRRWYSAHREHLYQWLARSGYSHAQVVCLYMAWNLLIVLPAVCWINRRPAAPERGVVLALVIYAAAIVLWWSAKRWSLQRVRHAHP